MSTPFLYIQLHIFAKFNKKNSIKQYWVDGDNEKTKFTALLVLLCMLVTQMTGIIPAFASSMSFDSAEESAGGIYRINGWYRR